MSALTDEDRDLLLRLILLFFGAAIAGAFLRELLIAWF